MEQHGAGRAWGELDEHQAAAGAEEDRAASEVNEEWAAGEVDEGRQRSVRQAPCQASRKAGREEGRLAS